MELELEYLLTVAEARSCLAALADSSSDGAAELRAVCTSTPAFMLPAPPYRNFGAGLRYNSCMQRIFLSHATLDRELVQHACTRMSNLGVEMYTAEHDPRAGEPVHDKVLRAIERSTVVVVLLTSRGYESTYVQQEIGYAKAKGKLVIPIVTGQTKRLDLGMLQGLEYIEADEMDPSAALDVLDRRVAALVRQQQQAETQTLLVVGAALVLILLLASGE